jgi:hypothetical protein
VDRAPGPRDREGDAPNLGAMRLAALATSLPSVPTVVAYALIAVRPDHTLVAKHHS